MILLSAVMFAAALLTGAAAPAFGADPIHVESVQTYGGFYRDVNANVNLLPAGVDVSFQNDADAPATDVVFDLVNDGAVVAQFNDVGRFTKGVRIDHSFPLNPFSTHDRVEVVPAQASFANGTTWQNPDPPPFG